jgi:hypothetical protein
MPLPIVLNGVLFGGVLCVVLSLLIFGSARLYPRLWTPSYPPDIRARFGPLTKSERRQRAILALLVYGCVVAVLWLAILRIPALSGGMLTFPQIFGTCWIVLNVFNLIDLVVLDWFVLLTLRPRWAILPGTDANMAGYHDYAFHFRGFLKGLGITTIISAVVTGFALLVV